MFGFSMTQNSVFMNEKLKPISHIKFSIFLITFTQLCLAQKLGCSFLLILIFNSKWWSPQAESGKNGSIPQLVCSLLSPPLSFISLSLTLHLLFQFFLLHSSKQRIVIAHTPSLFSLANSGDYPRLIWSLNPVFLLLTLSPFFSCCFWIYPFS